MAVQEKVQECTRCIQNGHWPGITFDAAGVCSNCRSFDRYSQREPGPEKAEELAALLKKADKKKPPYQAVVGLSGGKDSSYMVHVLRRQFNARILAVTWDTGFLSPMARENIAAMIKALNIDHRFVSLSPTLRQRIYRAQIKNRCVDLCQVCMTGGIAAINGTALKEGIPLVAVGISPRTEPTAIPSQLHCTTDYRYLVETTKPYIKKEELSQFKYVRFPWVFYTLFVRRLKHLMLPDYVPWNEDHIFNVLSEEYGWQNDEDAREHFDCLVHPAIWYFIKKRTGTSPTVEKLSVLVRAGVMTREAALKRLKEYEPGNPPEASIRALCDCLEIPRSDLEPFMRGESLNVQHFGSTVNWVRRFRWMLWIAWKMGLTNDVLYRKF